MQQNSRERVSGTRGGNDLGMDGISLDSLPKWLRDAIDLNNEYAHRNTGRVQRFLQSGDSNNPESEKKKDERRMSALLRMLQDPAYARLYTDAVATVDAAERASERALVKIAIEHEFAAEHLKAVRGGAATLPDGRHVYVGQNGRLIAEDGSDVTAQRDEVKGLSETTPSFEDYKEAKKRLEDVERRQREVREYRRNTLEPFKRELGDQDHPPGGDRLRQIIQQTREAMPEDVRAEYARPRLASSVTEPKAGSAADDYIQSADLSAPDLPAHFKAAHDAEPGLAAAPLPGFDLKKTL